MSDYVKLTNFAAKDGFEESNPAKVVSGAEIDAEFNAIAAASALKANANNTALTGSGTAATFDITNLTVSASFTLGATPVTATGAELNILDGVTASTAEINYLVGVTSGIQSQIDAITAGSTSWGSITGTLSAQTDLWAQLDKIDALTSTELNILDGATVTTAELNQLDGNVFTSGVREAYAATAGSGTINLDASVDSFFSTTVTGNVTYTLSLSDGDCILLRIASLGSTDTITWPIVGLEWISGSAPTLDQTSDNYIVLFKSGGTVTGSYVGVGS